MPTAKQRRQGVVSQGLKYPGNEPYQADHFSHSISDADFPANPGVHFIYGKSRRKPRKRPIGYVRSPLRHFEIAWSPS